MKNLSQLNTGEWGSVVSISPSSNIRRRLQDIGLVEGTKVRCLHKGPWGDPVAYYIRGAVIALRNEDSVAILID